MCPYRLLAGDIYVNNISGSDSNTGLKSAQAFRTFKKAVSSARPGDFIRLANTGIPYKEMLYFMNKSGEMGNPITVEGNGAVISGSEPLDISQWQEVSPGLYKNSVLYRLRKFNMDVVHRYFFLFGGKMNRMGRCLKGENKPYKKPSELLESEWTFTEGDNCFYLKIDSRKRLSDYKIEHPIRPTGVEIAGTSSYIIIRNVISTLVYNDGFGITNTANHLKFENITSLYCGDDGISAHAECQYDVDGFISIGNGTGICDTGNSKTTYNRVLIQDCVGVDLFFLNEKPGGKPIFLIRNSIIMCNAFRPLFFVTEKPEGKMDVTIDNILVVGKIGHATDFKVNGNICLSITNSAFVDIPMDFNADTVILRNSVVSGKGRSVSKSPKTVWIPEKNLYQVGQIQFDSRNFSLNSDKFKEYQQEYRDLESSWVSDWSIDNIIKINTNNLGFNINRIPPGKVKSQMIKVIKSVIL